VRCSPDEKLVWNQAAKEMGLTQSEWARDVMNAAAVEVLDPDEALDRAIGVS
jgi:hypothetical protein